MRCCATSWLTIRLPRVLLALLVGAALALSGCVMQGLFRNPLADPGLLGISSGAALAVACWLVLPLSASGLIALYMPMLAAFIGSLAVMVVIFILSQGGGFAVAWWDRHQRFAVPGRWSACWPG